MSTKKPEPKQSPKEYWLAYGVDLDTPPNKAKVAILASHLLKDEEIAATLAISPKQLQEGYGATLRRARLAGKGMVRSAQAQSAIRGNTISGIWVGKQELNQADKVETTLIGATRDVKKIKKRIEKIFGESVSVPSRPEDEPIPTIQGTDTVPIALNQQTQPT